MLMTPKPHSRFSTAFLGQPLPPEERRVLLEDLFVFGKDNQRPYLIRMSVLLVISTLIATSGLLANSAAVVIGAMLVAPMMRPVMSCGAAITLGWPKRFYQSVYLALAMAVAAVGISAIMGALSPDLIFFSEQIMARTVPTFYDLVIALAAGAGGAYTMTRKESSAIPGVAMAVALLPPLASTGVLLVYLEYDLALKAFILFATNLVAMVFAASVTFHCVGVRPNNPKHKHRLFTRSYYSIFFLLIFVISVPLYFYSHEVWYDAMYKAYKSEELQDWLKKNQAQLIDVKIDIQEAKLYLDIKGPNPPTGIDELYDNIYQARVENIGRTDPFSIEVNWTQASTFTWPMSAIEKEDIRALKTDYSQILMKDEWRWVGTQYTDGDWLRPDSLATIDFNSSETMSVNSSCGISPGTYELNQEVLLMSIKENQACETDKKTERFLIDLDLSQGVTLNEETINITIEGGIMYFEKHHE